MIRTRGCIQLLRTIVLSCIRFYQRVISPLSPARCRFVPSCSEYALEAVSRHGVAYGGWLAVKRLFKCGPWHAGGIDHVPGSK